MSLRRVIIATKKAPDAIGPYNQAVQVRLSSFIMKPRTAHHLPYQGQHHALHIRPDRIRPGDHGGYQGWSRTWSQTSSHQYGSVKRLNCSSNIIRVFRPHLGGGQLHLWQRGEDHRAAGRHQRLRCCEWGVHHLLQWQLPCPGCLPGGASNKIECSQFSLLFFVFSGQVAALPRGARVEIEAVAVVGNITTAHWTLLPALPSENLPWLHHSKPGPSFLSGFLSSSANKVKLFLCDYESELNKK